MKLKVCNTISLHIIHLLIASMPLTHFIDIKGHSKVYIGPFVIPDHISSVAYHSFVWLCVNDVPSSKGPSCQCRKPKRCRFHLWVRKTPWRRAWQPTAVFLPEESYGQRRMAGDSP